MRILLTCAALALVAACNDTSSTSEPLLADTGSSPDELFVAADEVIPTRYHGVWDYVESSCSPESDLRMEITGTDITFYESYGKAMAAYNNKSHSTVTLRMEGEGESWGQRLRLRMSRDGKTLLVNDESDPFDDPNIMPRKKCPS